jgi:hypothetical protein
MGEIDLMLGTSMHVTLLLSISCPRRGGVLEVATWGVSAGGSGLRTAYGHGLFLCNRSLSQSA